MKFLERYNHPKILDMSLLNFALLEANKRKLKTIVETGCARGKQNLFFFQKLIGKMV